MSVIPVEQLQHDLNEYFTALEQLQSTKDLLKSRLYQQLKPEVERVLESVVHEDLADTLPDAPAGEGIRVTAWNIERGIKLEGIIDTLRNHPEMNTSDVFLLTELDHGMARSGNKMVAREIAEALGLNYVFAPSYINLSKGSGLERDVDGYNTHAIHGNAIFSRYPLTDPTSIALPNSKDKMAGREKRLGSQRIPVATVNHPHGPLRLASAHLDAHSSKGKRKYQLQCLLDYIDTLSPRIPVLIGGDWNTSTYNCSKSVYAILGFWRRVFLGVRHVMANHYPYPERWFERPLFRMLERRGYSYKDLNIPGACTLHYDVLNIAMNSNVAEWVPQWCFYWVKWSLRHSKGLCSFKLDWFTGKHLKSIPGSAKVVGNLCDDNGPLSDHDAIVVDVLPEQVTPTG